MFRNIWKELENIGNRETLEEMALPKDKVEKLCASLGEKICWHLIACGVYKNTLMCLSHWVEEIASWLDRINIKEVKTPSGRLKKRDYAKIIYRDNIGENLHDLESAIADFRDDNCATDKDKELSKYNKYVALSIDGKDYPYFDITNDLILNTYSMIEYFISKTTDILSRSGNGMTKDNWESLVLEIFHKYKIC